VKAEDVRPIDKHFKAFVKGEDIQTEPAQSKGKVTFVSKAKLHHETKLKSSFLLQAQDRLGRQLRPGEAEAMRVIRNLKLKQSRQNELAQTPSIYSIDENYTDSTKDLEDEGDKNIGGCERQVEENVFGPSVTEGNEEKVKVSQKGKGKTSHGRRKTLTLKTIEYSSYNRENEQVPDSQNKLLEPETDNEEKASKDDNESVQDLSLIRETLNINSPASKAAHQLTLGREEI